MPSTGSVLHCYRQKCYSMKTGQKSRVLIYTAQQVCYTRMQCDPLLSYVYVLACCWPFLRPSRLPAALLLLCSGHLQSSTACLSYPGSEKAVYFWATCTACSRALASIAFFFLACWGKARRMGPPLVAKQGMAGPHTKQLGGTMR